MKHTIVKALLLIEIILVIMLLVPVVHGGECDDFAITGLVPETYGRLCRTEVFTANRGQSSVTGVIFILIHQTG